MTEIRKFGPANTIPLPRPGVKGLSAAVIQLSGQLPINLSPEELIKRYNGMPFRLDYPVTVVSLYFDESGEMDEHAAPFPIFFLVIAGSGFVRVGGPEAETQAVTAGDALLWPANVLHTAWTEDTTMQAITIECAPANS